MPRLVILLVLLALPASGQTTASDDSCDIAVTPAATLLLPYFEVDFEPTGRTTLFTITNVSPLPQIARATIWTDWGFPAHSFDLFLTGYDSTTVDLRDVVVRGRLPSPIGGTPGPLSEGNVMNPNHLVTMPSDCAAQPAELPIFLLRDLRSVLTTGRTSTGLGISCGNQQLGSNRGASARGSVTIDVVATCSPRLPIEEHYFRSELLFDNVLIGDWMTVVPNGGFAVASPLVHIRAIPEGGPAGSFVQTNLPFTFYDRLTSELPRSRRTFDRRQPLPTTFAARFIDDGGGSFSTFTTRLLLWREPYTGGSSACSAYVFNRNMPVNEVVRFDEHENASVVQYFPFPLPPSIPGTAAAQELTMTDPLIPYRISDDRGGWLYLNLGIGGTVAFSTARDAQNWVTVLMRAEERYGVAFDAAALRNGCSAVPRRNTRIEP